MLRQQVLPTCRVYGVITDGGVKPNIIPQRSELYYDIAAPTFKVRDELKERVMCCVNAAATATGKGDIGNRILVMSKLVTYRQ